MLNSPQSHRVALLIDADNTQLGYLKQILKLAQRYGTITICRAYGDWQKPQLSPWHQEILTHKIKPIQQDRIGKNSTDHLLLIEAVEILGTDLYEGTADVFIIVSGDGGFIPLCGRIKQKGKKIIGVGNRKQTSPELQKACDSFYYIEDLDKALGSKIEPVSPKSPGLSDLKTLIKLLDTAFSELDQTDGWVGYSPLGSKLRQLDPNFENQFGSKKLSEWLRSLDEHFESREQMVRRIDPESTQRIRLMRKAYHQTRRPDGMAHRSQFVEALRKLDPAFKTRFSGKTLAKCLETYSHIFKIHKDLIGLVVEQ